MTSIRLKALLAKGEFILAPGVFEMFSARISDRIGFKALYMTGYGVSGSHLGVADAGLVTYRATFESQGKPAVEMFVSTLYRRYHDGWKGVFYQQTLLPPR